MGTVSGGKTAKAGTKVTLKATPSKGYVFAGWYRDAAFDEPVEGDIDYRTASYAYVVGEEDATFYARFIPADEDWVEVDVTDEIACAPKAEIAPFVISVRSGSLATVKVSGLPAGLKFTAKAMDVKATKTTAAVHYEANTIYGTPTKSGIYVATVTATTVGKKSATATVKFVVRGAGETMVDAVWDSSRGKVTGLGVCAAGKSLTLKATANKNFVFAGWYLDADYTTPAVGTVDYRNASFPVANAGVDQKLYARFEPTSEDVSVSAEVEERYAVNGPWTLKLEISSLSLPSVSVKGLPTGLKFDAKALTISGTPTKPGTSQVTLSVKNVSVKKAVEQKFFIDIANIESSYLEGVDYAPGAYAYRGGTVVDWDISSCARGGYTVTGVTGLPTGLKFNAKTGKVEGVPSKAGSFTATITLKNGKQTSTATVSMKVDALDAWAVGTFNGGSEAGQVQLTVAGNGKVSGKLLEDGLTYTLAAPGYAAYDAETECYRADMTASWSYKEGKKTVKASEIWPVTVTEGDLGGVVSSDRFEAWQTNWKVEPWKSLGKGLDKKTLTYETVDGRVTLTFSANGTVKAAGEFATVVKGKTSVLKVSGSANVVVTADDPFAGLVFVYFPPNEAKGFAGHARMVDVE